jgi:hypothetical protein
MENSMDGMGGFWVTMIVLVSTVSVFGAIVAIIVLPVWARERTKRSAHGLIEKAIEKGEHIDPQLMEKLTQTIEVAQRLPRKTLGNAIWLLAIAGGFAAASFLGESDLLFPPVILGAIGAAFLILAIVDYSQQKKEG